ncbi:hypothetical protein SAMN05421636_10821 [Pricia antarctica]|uniref:Uncharacterized protein n=1 Tax=Pricia antarctica TaxID=641691 RepID=A0A1G7G8Q6_9FLAO|nr:hypothetical protein [Pricia antarctica]SDE84483.1 hypothetical protein SAMN05421636_10821 [Pricia antarctica]
MVLHKQGRTLRCKTNQIYYRFAMQLIDLVAESTLMIAIDTVDRNMLDGSSGRILPVGSTFPSADTDYLMPYHYQFGD